MVAQIEVADFVEIIAVAPGDEALLHRMGRVMMIVDGDRCVVALDDGGGATVNIKQLKKVG
jgi:hypothetical protein